jgi:hypothetical protein
VQLSAEPAERTPEIVWMKNAPRCTGFKTAENGAVLLRFLRVRLTGRKTEDCYTFERFASSPDEFRTYYYYYYKRKRVVLKEETKWS